MVTLALVKLLKDRVEVFPDDIMYKLAGTSWGFGIGR